MANPPKINPRTVSGWLVGAGWKRTRRGWRHPMLTGVYDFTGAGEVLAGVCKMTTRGLVHGGAGVSAQC